MKVDYFIKHQQWATEQDKNPHLLIFRQMETSLLTHGVIEIIVSKFLYLMGFQDLREQWAPELGNFIFVGKQLCQEFFMFIIMVSTEIDFVMVTMELDKNFNISCMKPLA